MSYVSYLTYTAGVPRQESDADVLRHVYRRLFAESRELFKAAHIMGMESFNATTTEDYLRRFGEALRQERRAIEMQREAIELQRMALELRAKGWKEFKAKAAGKSPAS